MNLPPDAQRSAPNNHPTAERHSLRGHSQVTYCISFSALFTPSPFQNSSKVPSSRVCSLTLHAHFVPPLGLGEYVDVLITFLSVFPCFQLSEAARISFPKAIISSSGGISDGLIGSPLIRTLDSGWDIEAAEESRHGTRGGGVIDSGCRTERDWPNS